MTDREWARRWAGYSVPEQYAMALGMAQALIRLPMRYMMAENLYLCPTCPASVPATEQYDHFKLPDLEHEDECAVAYALELTE